MNRKCLVKKLFSAAQFDEFHQIFRCALIHLSAVKTGINKRLEARMGDKAGATPSDFPKQTRNCALRKVVSLNFIFQSHSAEFGSQVPVSLDNPLDQAFMGQMVKSLILAVPLPGGPDNGEISRTAGIQKNSFQSQSQLFGMGVAHKPADCHRIAIPDQS